MKVLTLTTQYPNQVEPTRGMYHRQIMRELQAFCDVRVVAPVQWPYPLTPYRLYREVPEHEMWDSIETWHPRYVHLPLVGRSLTGTLYTRSVWPTVRRLYQESPFDAIAAYFVYPDGYAAVRFGERLGVPVTVGALGTDINRMLFEGLRKHLVRQTLKRADALLSVSSDLARKMAAAGIDPTKIRVIPNGVDPRRFYWRDPREARKQLELPLDRPILLFVGWLVSIKGLMELVQAVKALVQGAFPDLLLVLVGSGPLEPQLREFIATHQLEDHIWLVGARPHEEIPLWMNACDLFCLPSWMEGCPNVVVEARAAGKPVVATQVGGVPDLIPDARYGILVPPKDVEALTKALQQALERSWDGEAILALAHRHTWRDVARETFEQLQAVVQRRQAIQDETFTKKEVESAIF